MPRKSRRTRGRRSGAPQAVTSLSLSETFELKLSKRKDLSQLMGKMIVSVPLTAGIGNIPFLSTAFGARTSAFLALFQRWKIQRLVIKPLTTLPTPITSQVVAISDDVSVTFSTAATQSELLELRCSRILGNQGTDTSEFVWNPIDPGKWYYTLAGTDPRLSQPGAIYVNLTPTTITSAAFLVYYSISCEGAYDGNA